MAKLNVKHVAKLASLPLSDKELAEFEPQLEKILGYVDQLQKIDTLGVEETSQVTGKVSELRSDRVEPSPLDMKGYVKAKAIFNND